MSDPREKDITVRRKANCCFVYGCSNASRVGQAELPSDEKVHIFSFPSDLARREVWVHFVQQVGCVQ